MEVTQNLGQRFEQSALLLRVNTPVISKKYTYIQARTFILTLRVLKMVSIFSSSAGNAYSGDETYELEVAVMA